MHTSQVVIHVLGGAAALAVALSAGAARAAGDAALRSSLDALARRTVFFGHQSVGGNILDGLQELAAAEGAPVRVLETSSPAGLAPGTWAHQYIGENGNPDAKLQAFSRALGSGAAPDVALMKFCYVDFQQGTDVPGLFARYQSTLRALQASHPRTAFVHVTVPLTAAQGGLKAFAKRLLGRATSEALNARREEFNALLRQAYQGREPLFDLARLESTGPGGQPETAEWSGRQVPVLAAAYTDDGGHLNQAGRRRVARELATFLASLPPAPGGGGTR